MGKRGKENVYFLFNVKLRIDSSSMSVRHEGLSVFADDAACEVACAEEDTSTSTTLRTALPSRTLRTFSASQCLVAEGEEGEPEKASQKAPPSLLKRVWLAMAATAACSFDGGGVALDLEDELKKWGLRLPAKPWGCVIGCECGCGWACCCAAIFPQSCMR